MKAPSLKLFVPESSFSGKLFTDDERVITIMCVILWNAVQYGYLVLVPGYCIATRILLCTWCSMTVRGGEHSLNTVCTIS